MSLSARLALEPSRVLVVLERTMAACGLAVALATAAWRWPGQPVPLVLGAAAASALLIASDVARRRRSGRCTIVVGDRLEVGLLGARAPDDDASWRLAEPTMIWPGFAVVALATDAGARRVMPVVTATLEPRARRALARFLVWSLRAGRSSAQAPR